ncbi:unnamed protein product [Rotaria socialis]|uniref:Flavin-containing monooxygenase n=2 Tax=Rotaria socialis TaxID=392032 RepID=A0A820IRA0_9BILA|nr:unnamed protein product [Rotaria socialis]CAF3415637.1 unnamed protein product [Rotaria socialis]CAF3583080.1 unnamed protein product [Rotaria socialis]CAF3644857.1 unnamed protein product [Rotaria socialis]CAF4216876.1 unnamed protein product [Rotaria socialis]
MMKKRIAIIGAGPCGLSQLSALKDDAFDLVCFERQSEWGGQWLYPYQNETDSSEEYIHSSMYRQLWSNGPKELVEYVDYTFDNHFGYSTPSYQPRSVVFDYLTGRAKNKNIRKFIRFQTVVHNVNNEQDIFKVTVEDLKTSTIEELTFEFVIVAAGRYATPNIPQFHGMKQFPGLVLHSKHFHDASEFVNQHVLIIGSSYSAEDIALQLCKFGARAITISYRTRPLGYKWPDERIKEVPLLERIENRLAYFQDGTESESEIDSIILCTGYRHHYPFMAEHLRLNCPTKVLSPPNLYKGIIWSKQPNLAYLGMQSLVFQFTMFDVQASFVRDVILGQIKLPDLESREQNIAEWIDLEKTLKPGDGESEFYYQINYMRDLLTQCHAPPQFDVNKVIAGVKELVQHKQENVFTYRDHSFVSIVTGSRALSINPSLPWLQNMADSVEEFLNQSLRKRQL